MRRNGTLGGNALARQLVVRVDETTRASAERVYALLADLATHLIWAGNRQPPRTRLLYVDAPSGPADVGTEFHTTGADPMGTFDDRSVVTEAHVGNSFEFVTEARLTTNRGRDVDWTIVHRYDLAPTPVGCLIVYTIRIVRISALTGMLVTLRIPGLRQLAIRASMGSARRGVRNLARLAEEIEERR